MTSLDSIPTVDFQDFLSSDARRRSQFVQTIGDALVDIGFFALKNHGIDLALVDRAYAMCEQFFLLPEARKVPYENIALKGQRGYVSFGREHAKTSSFPDLKEFWHVGREHYDDSHVVEKYEPNVWPQEVQEFKSTMTDIYDAVDRCAIKLLDACALYLGEPQHLISDMAKNGNSILRAIHYPPVAKEASGIRAAAHEDINLITLLFEATAGGLELLERDGSWRAIHALKGHIIVDSGDMLQNLSNGVFKSTTHRVVNPNGDFQSRRFSMPFFCHPRRECSLNPLASCITREGGQQKYPNISAGDYLDKRLKEIGL